MTREVLPSKLSLNLHVLNMPSIAVEPEISDEDTITSQSEVDRDDVELIAALTDLSELLGMSIDGQEYGIERLLGRDEILEVYERIKEYLGYPENLSEALEADRRPHTYSYYIGKLATYFGTSDDTVTTNFGDFTNRHSEQRVGALGPLETNSRGYAVISNELILRQLGSFYDSRLEINLKGPTKKINGKNQWKRGVAECQFMILDKIRDAYIRMNHIENEDPGDTMSLQQIGDDISELMNNRSRIDRIVRENNPLIADFLSSIIGSLVQMTTLGFYRGRPASEPRFYREAPSARRLLLRVKELLELSMLESSEVVQEDVVALDLEDI